MARPTHDPSRWYDFKHAIRRFAPRSPVPYAAPTEAQRRETDRGQAVAAVNAFATGAGVSTGTHGATTVASTSAEDAVNSLVDTAVEAGVTRVVGSAAGAPTSGLIALLRGGYTSLNNASEMQAYVLGTLAYVNTLARCCVLAMNHPDEHFTRFPRQEIPTYLREHALIHTEHKRRKFRAGIRRLRSAISSVDEIGVERGHHLYSRQCLDVILFHANGHNSRSETQVRNACERYILKHLVSVNLQSEAERIRRANR